MNTKYLQLLILFAGTVPGVLLAQTGNVKTEREKSDDDPTKVTTQVGVAWSDNYDFNDSDVTFSGSLALDPARKLNARINSDASEWRVGGSWLFPIGIFNFNIGKNDFSNGASQTNYSVGTFLPLSYFGIEPAGFQIFPMAGYTYNTGEAVECQKDKHSACEQAGFNGAPSPENGFAPTNISGGSGYLGAFVLKPVTESLRLMAFLGGSYGSENDNGENYKGYFGGVGMGYSINQHHSFRAMTYIQDNNTYIDNADKRLLLAYKYQF
ncbi:MULTISPECIES: hypothetical protein [Enterobacter cloacae complex]|uniref:hypothetical protein n=3 Tax=Enterobacteriaceae TaxID=543 RepID=UPI000651AEF4|nr:hypothetical protein [Enterobacter kobei]EJV1482244.1 hypothetical protein [Enterobacter hormaechei]KLW34096.1 hypothetical protein SK51_02595 [Enterobacter sp. MGH85]MCU3498410.1 hypothetical protein [Enterobacter hormaechei subsp. hoffmannii]EKU4498710.1 hypothetical protein [Enterobacter hormaechei]EKW0706186.1 hypothetical protein [Enterobacter hormaechei]